MEKKYHSEEVLEIIGKIPTWIVRRGILLIISILTIIGFSMYFIQYPKTIEVPVVLTTHTSPAPLVTKVGGKIIQWFVSNNDTVKTGSPIALLENDASYSDVLFLLQILNHRSDSITDFYCYELAQTLDLGDNQQLYFEFCNLYNEYESYRNLIQQNSKSGLIKEQIEFKRRLRKQLRKQGEVKEELFLLVKKQYFEDSIYYTNGGVGIIKTEFEHLRKNYLSQKSDWFSFYASVITNEEELLALQKEFFVSQTIEEQTKIEYEYRLREKIQLLKIGINRWLKRFLVTAPIDGEVTFTKYWSTNQVLDAGETLAVIVPDDEFQIIVRAYIPIGVGATVERGQKVNIKLNSYPYIKHGVLKGYISSVSKVPINESYIGEISLTEGMISTYGEKLKFVQEMSGKADIIQKESRLIFKLLSLD